ncbi:glycoside hydrolase family 30 protein [Paludibacter sp.]|uniref:glycoside hydrolase family 30 protein n=1 Tax=Paludibacter sp. TaxID=1898105 RepID=UPI001352C53F|nr:glycoside hydrolase family 30 protein [Paludibacter sp.]MTK52070.1 glycosyl hydrolase [Paludibacter sp.]
MQKFLLSITLVVLSLYSGTAITFAQKKVEKEWKSTVYTTAENTALRISQTENLQFHKAQQPVEKEIWVFVDPTKAFQSVIGIGGAITDASAETFAKLPVEKQNEILKAFFDPKNGIGYSMIRTNIGSCDFSSDSYSYVDSHDTQLKTFNVSHDEKYKIPLIKKATTTGGGKLPLFVSPWSPPAWMKDNNSLIHGGKLLPEYAQSWANYLVKFIRTYESKGIPVWGISVQNEPMAIQTWESCIFTADEERDFIKNHLGPTLVKTGLGSKKLIAWDHNRDLFYQRASGIMSDPEAAKYVWGFGYHWYETWSGSGMQFENLKRVKEAFPSKHIFFSEGCIEKYDASKVNEWWLGERYGKSMIIDFNNGSEGWIDWNILLDQTGGPNHAGNFCYAPVHADTNTGALTYTNIFYYQGHFSKFVKPGAKRIACSTTRDQLLATAFRNQDGIIDVIVMNPTDNSMNYNLLIKGVTSPVKCLPHSISTIVIK